MKIGSSNAMQWVLDSPGSGGSGDLWQSVFNTSFKQVLNVLKDSNKKSLRSLDLRSEQEAAACSGTGNALVAGTQVGPANLQELALQMVPAAAGAAMDTATMSPPTSLLLSIPGLTQVQYYYKGLTNGPESRDFKLKGHVVPSGKGAKIYLEMVGDVTGGDKQLYVEYMVNYKKEVHPFPTWSPFLDEPADAQRSGIEPIYTQSPTLVQTKSGPVAGKPITGRTDLVMAAPFATLHETGSQRNGVKAWHGYEYTWNAWKVMEPIPGGSTP